MYPGLMGYVPIYLLNCFDFSKETGLSGRLKMSGKCQESAESNYTGHLYLEVSICSQYLSSFQLFIAHMALSVFPGSWLC